MDLGDSHPRGLLSTTVAAVAEPGQQMSPEAGSATQAPGPVERGAECGSAGPPDSQVPDLLVVPFDREPAASAKSDGE